MDNFSRKILLWKLARELKAVNSREVISTALLRLPIPERSGLSIMTDGGPENDSSIVREFLEKNSVSLLLAQQDISCSNSMVEAVNKSLKYRHIFPYSMPVTDRLKQFIAQAIAEYNDRPHTALKGLTPGESHAGFVFDRKSYSHLLTQARNKRMEINRKACPPCQVVSVSSGETDETVVSIKDHGVHLGSSPVITAEYQEVGN